MSQRSGIIGRLGRRRHGGQQCSGIIGRLDRRRHGGHERSEER